jgi:hypothetical protein
VKTLHYTHEPPGNTLFHAISAVRGKVLRGQGFVLAAGDGLSVIPPLPPGIPARSSQEFISDLRKNRKWQ